MIRHLRRATTVFAGTLGMVLASLLFLDVLVSLIGGPVNAASIGVNLDSFFNGAAPTQGAVLCRSSSGWKTYTGAANQFLESQGTGADCTFAAVSPASGGGLYSGNMSAIPTMSGTGLSTWLNQGTATEADAQNGMYMSDPTGSGTNIRGLCMETPSNPYTITILGTIENSPNLSTGMGLWFEASSKLQGIELATDGTGNLPVVLVTHWSSPTAFVGTDATITNGALIAWEQVQRNGTTLNYNFSIMGGTGGFTTAFTTTTSGYLGANPDHVCAAVQTNSNPASGGLLSFSTSSP